MSAFHSTALVCAVAFCICIRSVVAAEYYVSTGGRPNAPGTPEAPWDLATALDGRQHLAPGDTIWIERGTYRYDNRQANHGSYGSGYPIRLKGTAEQPIHVRPLSGHRVTIDGGLTFFEPASYVWVWSLEVIVSENLTMSRTIQETGSSPQSLKRPWGGVSLNTGAGCKLINLVVHDCCVGLIFWSGCIDSEVHGCIIYDNGWGAPDRGHGHAIYLRNTRGHKIVSDCIMTGGYSYTMHAYSPGGGAVKNLIVEGNVAYDGGTFLVGDSGSVTNVDVVRNYLANTRMRLGYDSLMNEDCRLRDNIVFNERLDVERFRHLVNERNLVIGQGDPAPTSLAATVVLRPNRYDPDRANLIIFNWRHSPTVSVNAEGFLKRGDEYRLMDPRDFFGTPVAEGIYQGRPFPCRSGRDFSAFVLLRGAQQQQLPATGPAPDAVEAPRKAEPSVGS